MGNNRDICCYANRGVVNFEREYWRLPPGIIIPVVPQLILGKKNEKKPQFTGQNSTFFMVPQDNSTLAFSIELLNYIVAFATQGKNGHYKIFDR